MFRECVSIGAAGAQTRRTLGHHLLHLQIFEAFSTYWNPQILRSRTLFYRTDSTCRSKFLTHSLMLTVCETEFLLRWLLITMANFKVVLVFKRQSVFETAGVSCSIRKSQWVPFSDKSLTICSCQTWCSKIPWVPGISNACANTSPKRGWKFVIPSLFQQWTQQGTEIVRLYEALRNSTFIE